MSQKTIDIDNLDLELTKELNKISFEIKDNCINLFDDLYEENPSIVSFASNLLSKDSNFSDSYKLISQLFLIHKLLLKKPRLTIKVSNKDLYRFCKKKFKTKKIILNTQNLSFFKIKSVFYIFLTIIINITFKFLFHNKEKYSEINLIDTFVLKSSLNNGKYNDRWYNSFKFDLKNCFYLPTLLVSPFKLYSTLKTINDSNRFILKESFLGLKDYLKILKIFFSQNLVIKNKVLNGVDISEFLHKQHTSYRYNISTFRALCNYYFIHKFIKKGNTINSLINWNENQPIDKCLVRAISDFTKETKVVGIRSFVSSPQNLNLYISKFEFKNNLSPKTFFICSPHLKNFYNFVKNDVILKPFNYNRGIGLFDQKTKEKKIILSILPIDFELSQSIIKDINYLDSKLNDFIFYIKIHPNFKKQSFANLKNKNYINQDKFSSVFEKSFLIITSNSTSGIEAINNNKFVIFRLKNSRFFNIPMINSLDKRFYQTSFSSLETESKIKFFTKQSVSSYVLKRNLHSLFYKDYPNKLSYLMNEENN